MSVDDVLVVEVELTPEDIGAFQRHTNRRVRWTRANIAVVVTSVVPVGAAGAISGADAAVWAALGTIAFCAAVIVVAARRRPSVAEWASGTFAFDAEGVTIEQPDITTRLRWTDLTRADLTDHHVFLRRGPYMAWIIPRRCLADQRDARRLVALAGRAEVPA